MPVDLKVFGLGTRTGPSETMSDDDEGPRFRQHLRELGRALGGIGRDVKLDVTDAPRVAREGAKNAFARAAGVRRAPMREWSDSDSADSK